MKKYLETHRTLFGTSGAVMAFAVAMVYFWVIPEQASAASGVQKTILLYGHSACWILLCTASVLWARGNNKWATSVAFAGLAAYVVFMITLVTTGG